MEKYTFCYQTEQKKLQNGGNFDIKMNSYSGLEYFFLDLVLPEFDARAPPSG